MGHGKWKKKTMYTCHTITTIFLCTGQRLKGNTKMVIRKPEQRC